jgi:hypothetical protein
MKSRILIASGFLFALVSMPAAAVAPEEDFIGRFGGAWSGSGTVIKGDMPFQVSCQATGQPGPNEVAIEGSCSAVIASMRIAADIAYDPATGRYSGTYTGARVGPAQVTGKRSGDVVHLTVNWPAPVNGQMKAELAIENAGGGQLRIRLNEFVAPDGSLVTTHDLVLSQA